MARKKGTKTNAEKKKKAKEDNKKSTRKKTPTFTQRIKMQVDKYDAEFIDSKMFQMNNTPADLFERYSKTGVGGKPIIVDCQLPDTEVSGL